MLQDLGLVALTSRLRRSPASHALRLLYAPSHYHNFTTLST